MYAYMACTCLLRDPTTAIASVSIPVALSCAQLEAQVMVARQAGLSGPPSNQ